MYLSNYSAQGTWLSILGLILGPSQGPPGEAEESKKENRSYPHVRHPWHQTSKFSVQTPKGVPMTSYDSQGSGAGMGIRRSCAVLGTPAALTWLKLIGAADHPKAAACTGRCRRTGIENFNVGFPQRQLNAQRRQAVLQEAKPQPKNIEIRLNLPKNPSITPV